MSLIYFASCLVGLAGLNLLGAITRHPLPAAALLGLAVGLAHAPAALAVTILCEAAVVALIASRSGASLIIMLTGSAFINAVTQPLLYAAVPLLPFSGGSQWWLSLGVAEFVVCLIEAGLWLPVLRRAGVTGRVMALACLIAFTTNIASTLIGLILPL
jgi:hypothetical protein